MYRPHCVPCGPRGRPCPPSRARPLVRARPCLLDYPAGLADRLLPDAQLVLCFRYRVQSQSTVWENGDLVEDEGWRVETDKGL